MEKVTSPRERRKWGLGLAQHLKGASPNLLTESHYPGNKKNATMSEFGTFLKSSKSREQFLLRLTLFTLFTANG